MGRIESNKKRKFVFLLYLRFLKYYSATSEQPNHSASGLPNDSAIGKPMGTNFGISLDNIIEVRLTLCTPPIPPPPLGNF